MIQRYEVPLLSGNYAEGCDLVFDPDDSGEWVRWEDHERELSELQTEKCDAWKRAFDAEHELGERIEDHEREVADLRDQLAKERALRKSHEDILRAPYEATKAAEYKRRNDELRENYGDAPQ
jgi:hypothetical protein